ncbi:patatin-like phospholipase family protein [Enterococcus sp. AZ072]|uniref:patatin-like phospholipase family protein n=1 Tax=unclassified Enterococcus TaxID=2608891 RepID=UPI003D29CC31
MKVHHLYPSEQLNYKEAIQQARLLFPFDSSHQCASKRMVQAIKKYQVYSLTTQKIQVFIEVHKTDGNWQVHNLLTTKEMTWQEGISLVETAARQEFVQEIILMFSASDPLAHWLRRQGYTEQQNGWLKNLNYKTGLVLGGGGARGAYQIGVWQALLEKKIDFQCVVGCSVGALNGALMVQGDLTAAQTLWQEIATDKVLEVSFEALEQADFVDHVQQLRQFIFEAIRQKGLSTAPLYKLLQEHLDVEKMTKSMPLYIVATRVPTFQEVVVKLNDCSQKEMLSWLLASSAFFPLMSIEQIDEHFYVDGGYRNNIPIDVALKQGATELIVIDVHGPGIDKTVTIPSDVAEIQLATSWNLGEMMLFEANRAKANIKLGYLEMKRCLKENQGQRYFFENTEDFPRMTRKFVVFMRRKLSVPLKELAEIQQKNYHQPLEKLSLSLLEQWSEWLHISPLSTYRIDELAAIVCHNVEEDPELTYILSVKEHLSQRWLEMNRLSNYNRTVRLYRQKINNWERAFYIWPLPTLLVMFIEFIQEEFTWQENSVTKL